MLNLGPIIGVNSITPDDSNDIDTSKGARSVYVGTTGNVKVTFFDGTVQTLPNLAAGVHHPMKVKRIWSTGTTASNIFVGY